MTRPRIILADDHRMLAEAFIKLLAADYDIVVTVANGRDLVEAVKGTAAFPPRAFMDPGFPKCGWWWTQS